MNPAKKPGEQSRCKTLPCPMLSYLPGVYQMKYSSPRALCAFLMLFSLLNAIKSQEFTCYCYQDSCIIWWDYANRHTGCHQGDGWQHYVCGEGRGITWLGNTALAWQKKIDCELCTAGKIRTRIHDNQYKCVSETQAYGRIIEPYPDYVCEQFDGRWSCTCYKGECECWWDVVKNSHTGGWAHWTCGDTRYSAQTSPPEWWYAGQDQSQIKYPYSMKGFSYVWEYVARRVIGCQDCPTDWHRTYLLWVANGQWVCVPKMKQAASPNWPYSSCGSVTGRYGYTLQPSYEDYDGQVGAGGYCGLYHGINNPKGFSHPSRLGQACVCCEGQYKVSWKLTGMYRDAVLGQACISHV